MFYTFLSLLRVACNESGLPLANESGLPLTLASQTLRV